MKAEIINKGVIGFAGIAWLVRFSDKLSVSDYDGEAICETQYFIISGVNAMFTGWEVYVFAADEKGEVISWTELPPSARGITHEQALEALEDYVDSLSKVK